MVDTPNSIQAEPNAWEPPGGLWAKLEQATEAVEATGADLWASLRKRLDFSKSKPRRLAGVEVAQHRTSRGEDYYVLRNPQANTYLKITPEDYFLWQLSDGDHSVRDLALAYFTRYGSLPFQRLPHLLGQLKAKQLLADKPVEVFAAVATFFASRTLGYRLERFARTATQKEFSFKNADGFFDALYRRGGRLLFTWPAIVLFLLLAGAGLYAFAANLLAGTYPLFSTGGSYGLGLLVLLLASYGDTFFHECGHALACKFYGRQVPRAGILLYFGAPAFFVDTTDIWMSPKRARLVVSLAGPLATLLVGSLLSVVVALFPDWPLSPILFQVAFVSFVGVVLNLDPLIEADGYFLLMDWLEIPRLRAKSLAFVKGDLWGKVFRERIGLGREERIFAVYGVLAAVYAVFTVVLAVYLWQSRVGQMLDDLVSGRDILSSVLVGGLMLVAGGTLVAGLAIRAVMLGRTGVTRLFRWLRRRAKVAPGH